MSRLRESQQERAYRELMGKEAAERQTRAAKAKKCSCARKRELSGTAKGSHHHPTCAFYC